jgi:diguanylate cyclase (GGDEF)-like protein
MGTGLALIQGMPSRPTPLPWHPQATSSLRVVVGRDELPPQAAQALPAGVAEAMVAALDASGVAVCVCDEQDRVRYANRSFRDTLLGGLGDEPLAFADAVLRSFTDGERAPANGASREWLDAFVEDMRERRRTLTGSNTCVADLHDGRWLLVTETRLENGWLTTFAQDITPLKREEQRLREDRAVSEQAARTDDLTGIANRRHGLDLARRMHAEAGDAGRAMCVAFVDLDLFKRINDDHGHDAGDRVLVEFAGTCAARLQADEVFCRSGGEEFLFVSREDDPDRAVARLRRLLDDLPAVRVSGDVRVLHYTASAGVAVLQPHESWSELLRRADKALYRAKAAGRARVELAY